MANYKNKKTIQLKEALNKKYSFDYKKQYPQYRKQLNNRHKIVQLSNCGKHQELFNYLKYHGQFLGYSIYEECSLGNRQGSDTLLEYIYLCNGYYCSIIFNMSLKYNKYFSPIEGSEISISK